jgi:transposase
MSSSNGLLSKGDDGLGVRMAKAIVKHLQDGETPKEVSKALGVGYMAVYKIAIGKTWKTLTGGNRLIPKRKPKIRAKHRRWVARACDAGKTKAFIAAKLRVTETTVARIAKDNDMIQAWRLREALLTSGSEMAAAKALGINLKRAEQLMTIDVPAELPRRLQPMIAEEEHG